MATLPLQPGKAAKKNNEYIRRGIGVVLLVYNRDSGQRHTQTRPQRTKADYAEFMNELIATCYVYCEQIDVLQDKLNTHKYGSFYEHLPLETARQLSRPLP